MVQHLSGPSHFWRCQSCRSILQKKGTMAMVSAGATIAGSVSCGSCGRSYSASAVYGGQYDLPEVELHCPHCNTHLRGPGEELLGQPCPSCNRVLPKRHPYKYDDPAEAYAKAQYWIGMVALKQCPDVVSSLLGSLGLTQLPPEIAHLKTLTMLSLWDNRLSSLPPGIALLPALRELDLKDNQFSSLPPEIGRLTALTKLDLSDNQLSFLPPEIGRLTALTELNLSGNRLSSLPLEINQLTVLKKLYLHGNAQLALPPKVLGPTADDVEDVCRKKATPARPASVLAFYFRGRGGYERPVGPLGRLLRYIRGR